MTSMGLLSDGSADPGMYLLLGACPGSRSTSEKMRWSQRNGSSVSSLPIAVGLENVICNHTQSGYGIYDDDISERHLVGRSICGETVAVGDGDDDGGLQVVRIATATVVVDAALHAVEVEEAQRLAQRRTERGQTPRLKSLELLVEDGLSLSPARLQFARLRTRETASHMHAVVVYVWAFEGT
jgi:hypothetical protein